MSRPVQALLIRSRDRRIRDLLAIVVSLVLIMSTVGATSAPDSTAREQSLVQTAANEAAVAGARSVAIWTDTNTTVTALPAARNAAESQIWWTSPDVSCVYVDDSDTSLGDCDSEVPANATGVSVHVTETHATLLGRIFPWFPKQVTAEALATAHVQLIEPDGSASPFLVCGVDTLLVGGGTQSILTQQNSQWVIDEAAYGQTFEIHGPQVAGCGNPGNIFKGLADPENNEGLPAGSWFTMLAGVAVSPLSNGVDAPEGCPAGTTDPYNCILMLAAGDRQSCPGQWPVLRREVRALLRDIVWRQLPPRDAPRPVADEHSGQPARLGAGHLDTWCQRRLHRALDGLSRSSASFPLQATDERLHR